MISRAHRFHGHNSLNHAYRRGKSVHAENFSLRFVDSRKPDYRLAIVVSKKISKSAVKRNRIRRRLYEAFRLIKLAENKPWPHDMVVTVHKESLASTDAKELHAHVVQLLQKAQII